MRDEGTWEGGGVRGAEERLNELGVDAVVEGDNVGVRRRGKDRKEVGLGGVGRVMRTITIGGDGRGSLEPELERPRIQVRRPRKKVAVEQKGGGREGGQVMDVRILGPPIAAYRDGSMSEPPRRRRRRSRTLAELKSAVAGSNRAVTVSVVDKAVKFAKPLNVAAPLPHSTAPLSTAALSAPQYMSLTPRSRVYLSDVLSCIGELPLPESRMCGRVEMGRRADGSEATQAQQVARQACVRDGTRHAFVTGRSEAAQARQVARQGHTGRLTLSLARSPSSQSAGREQDEREREGGSVTEGKRGEGREGDSEGCRVTRNTDSLISSACDPGTKGRAGGGVAVAQKPFCDVAVARKPFCDAAILARESARGGGAGGFREFKVYVSWEYA